MRLFQFISAYKPYIHHLESKFPEKPRAKHRDQLSFYLIDRYYASHILHPVLNHDQSARFTVANDFGMQTQWARENGFKSENLSEILRAQIEAHKADVVYSLDPISFDSSFIRTLPSCVKSTIAWNAAPKGKADLSSYDLVVSNFPHIQNWWKSQGVSVGYFFPAHDPAMDRFANNSHRPIDVCFSGQFSNWWKTRGSVLHEIAKLSEDYLISFRLLAPKWKTLGDAKFLSRIKLPVPYIPPELRQISSGPVYGKDLYDLYSSSKIVFNASIDNRVIIGKNGTFRGNMRCFEALGCGACMLSDAGNYSDGFIDGRHFASYESPSEVVSKLRLLLEKPDLIRNIAQAGHAFVKEKFSKDNQWLAFQNLL